MTQMQMIQGSAQLPDIGFPVSGTHFQARSSKSFFALMMGGEGPQTPGAQEDSADASALSLMAPAALFIPGLFPQAAALEVNPETGTAAQTATSVSDAPARSDLAEGVVWTLPEPAGIQTQPAAPEAPPTRLPDPERGFPEGLETAGTQTESLPEFRLVQADKKAPRQTESPVIKEAAESPLNEQKSAEFNRPQTLQRTRFSEAAPAKGTEMQSVQAADKALEHPAEHVLKTGEEASTKPEHEQPDAERALAPPLTLSRFILERSAAAGTAEETPRIQTAEPALQLAEEVKIFAEKGSGQYVVELTPHELGRVTIELELTDGAVTLSFKAENPATQSLLASGTGELKAALENALARPVTLNPRQGEDADYRGQETFKERQNPKNQENPERRQRPREAFSGVIGRIRAG